MCSVPRAISASSQTGAIDVNATFLITEVNKSYFLQNNDVISSAGDSAVEVKKKIELER